METDHLTTDHTFSSALYTLGPINLQTHVSGMYLQTLPSQHPESRLNLGLWHCLYLGSGMEVFHSLRVSWPKEIHTTAMMNANRWGEGEGSTLLDYKLS